MGHGMEGSDRDSRRLSCVSSEESLVILTHPDWVGKVGRGSSGHFNFRSTVTKNGQTLGKLLAMYIQGLNLPTTH